MTAPHSSSAGLRLAWLAGLTVDGRLPERTVIVRTEAVAHAWRRDVITAGRPDLLIGTRFVTPLGVATAVLDLAGVVFATGEESVRAARIAALLAEDLPLQAFELTVLRERPGWEAALAATIGDLEAAGVDAAVLRSSADLRCADLAIFRERLDLAAGTSWTAARTLHEATSQLAADAMLWPFGGPCLAEVTGHETVALARFLHVLPRVTIVRLDAQPHRESHAQRSLALFGPLAERSLATAGTSERDLLATYLFAPPAVLLDPDRPRSPAPDGTLQLEEHAGVEEELEAAVTWAIAEVADHASSIEQLAIVVPHIDPHAGLLAERLSVLGADAVHVIGGLAASGTSTGARIATLLRAFEAYLHIDVLADVLPILKTTDTDHPLSRRDAITALTELGSVGGSSAHPGGALDWSVRIAPRLVALATWLANAPKDEDLARAIRARERTLAQLTAVQPAMFAVDAVARCVVDDRPLGELWVALDALLTTHVRTGVHGGRIVAALGAGLEPLITAKILRGHGALVAIMRMHDGLRFPLGRFGEARVTIAALRDAVGLSFRSVRVVGLAEGVLPANVREDAVLPDAVRASLGAGVPRSGDRALAQLHALHRVIGATTTRVVLSAPRMDLDRRYREPSGVMIEAAAAVGRVAGVGFIPDASAMRHAWFQPARVQLAATRVRWPVAERARLERAARTRHVPAAWHTAELRELARLAPAVGDAPTAMDGWFPAGPFLPLPGLSAEKPISASAVGRFLDCPHRFLYERVLGWSVPSGLADEGSIDALSYGSLFHETAETFYEEHGAGYCARKKKLPAWKAIATTVADATFAAFLETYPLVGASVQDAQRARLRRDLHALLDADWQTEKTFIAVERAFGPVKLVVAGVAVHLHGYIDRIDTVGKATLVRDLKTGRAKPRKADQDWPAYDVQLGIYGLVTRHHAQAWGVPRAIQGAYIYPSDSSGEDRDFTSDFDALAEKTEHWLAMTTTLLSERVFPRTPNHADCQFCSFKPVCGSAANTRGATLLGTADGALADFVAMKAAKNG